MAVQGRGAVVSVACWGAGLEGDSDRPLDHLIQGAGLSSQIFAASFDSSLDGSEGASYQGGSVRGEEVWPHATCLPLPLDLASEGTCSVVLG